MNYLVFFSEVWRKMTNTFRPFGIGRSSSPLPGWSPARHSDISVRSGYGSADGRFRTQECRSGANSRIAMVTKEVQRCEASLICKVQYIDRLGEHREFAK
jgi:hypothetical protein